MAGRNHEVEIKFRVESLTRLKRTLRAAGFRLVTPRMHEFNVLYDFAGQPLRQRGELLRLRKYGPQDVLTHKGPTKTRRGGVADRHKRRVETETAVADGAKLAVILDALGLSPTFRYEKFRSEWTDGDGHVVIDETPIGNLAEIEGPPRWIDRTASKLGVPRDQYITANYAQMFLEWKQNTGNSAAEMTFRAVGSARPKRRSGSSVSGSAGSRE